MKKAEGLSLNMVIIAAIGIIVLIVVIILFTNQASDTNSALQDCTAKGGKEATPPSKCESSELAIPMGDEANSYCCIPISG